MPDPLKAETSASLGSPASATFAIRTTHPGMRSEAGRFPMASHPQVTGPRMSCPRLAAFWPLHHAQETFSL
mgnify:CR=1 FL=1